MDAGDFTKIVIAAVMMIVIVVVVVIPVIDTSSSGQLGDNDPTGYASSPVISGAYKATATGYTVDGTQMASLSNGDWIIISDSCVVYKQSDTAIYVDDYANNVRVTLITLNVSGSAWSGTYSGTEYSGTIGANAVMRTASGDVGAYKNAAFRIDKTDELRAEVSTASFAVSGTAYSARALVSGTADRLTVDGIMIITGGNATFLQPSQATAVMSGYSVPNDKIFGVSTAATIALTITIEGTEYTPTTSSIGVIEGPLHYTEVTAEGDAIGSMLGLVPLLMIVGVIMMIIVAFVVRR